MSTGPKTDAGKQASRRNAVRHGLTAETVIGALEDAEDYKMFEAAITADYNAQSAVERELVLRLASLLWRLRRATTMETGLFEIQAEHLDLVAAVCRRAESSGRDMRPERHDGTKEGAAMPIFGIQSATPTTPTPTVELPSAFYVWLICPISHSIASAAMKQAF
jgi:hypothetical protein